MSNISRLRTRGLGTVAIVLSAAAAIAASRSDASANTAPSAATAPAAIPAPPDAWLKGITSKHKQFFDAPTPSGGILLIHMMNYFDTLNKEYAVKDDAIDAVGTFYGAATLYGVNDKMWAKYKLGEVLEANDPATGKPAVANPWRTSPTILGMALPQASVESLQKRGATFILCNNALGLMAGMVAKARGLPTDAVYADLKANILPGVELIPGMVVAIDQAHAIGMSYHRQ